MISSVYYSYPKILISHSILQNSGSSPYLLNPFPPPSILRVSTNTHTKIAPLQNPLTVPIIGLIAFLSFNKKLP